MIEIFDINFIIYILIYLFYVILLIFLLRLFNDNNITHYMAIPLIAFFLYLLTFILLSLLTNLEMLPCYGLYNHTVGDCNGQM